jgi:hypothetical protein
VIFKRQVVYLITSPLSKRDYDRFGIQRWLDRGWEVKVFDFTKFLQPEFWDYVDGNKLSIEFDGLKIFDNEKSALASLESFENGVLFIDFINSSDLERKMRLVAKNKGETLELRVGSVVPLQPFHSKLMRKAKNVLMKPSRIFTSINNIINNFAEGSPDYIVVGGSTGNIEFNNTQNKTIIKAHISDYDFLLNGKSTSVESRDGGLVFLDADVVWHSDFVHEGIKAVATAENYFSSMDKGLSQIAKALRYNVTIAAHPRSDYENRSLKYSFPILKDMTFELIKQASVVVSHDSTALAWAIIMRKPIILVTTDELYNNYEERMIIDTFALLLGKDVINLNRIPSNFNWESQLDVDETKYQNYIETYVKQHGSPEKPLWEIVIDHIETDWLHE